MVVTDAVRRWFVETSKEASKGDVVSLLVVIRSCAGNTAPLPLLTNLRLVQKQQALVGQMLCEGYGCNPDPAAGREWIGMPH